MRISPAPFGESIADAPSKKARNGGHDLVIRCGKQRRRVLAAGLPSPHREHLLNKGPATPSAGLPSPSSLRDATSPKGRGFGYTGKFAFSKKLSLWESWRKAPERASPAEAAQGVGLDSANDGADFRKAQSERTWCVLARGLALSVIASRCHLSQSERPWQSAKFPVPHFTPCCRKGSRRRYV